MFRIESSLSSHLCVEMMDYGQFFNANLVPENRRRIDQKLSPTPTGDPNPSMEVMIP